MKKFIQTLRGKNNEINSLEDIRVEDIVGREIVSPDRNLLSKNIYKKVVLVTGAGGSIGSEICRQLMCLSPKKIVLLDSSELALYNINEELAGHQVDIIPVLGSICNKFLIDALLLNNNVDTVYHAAAYKHVPLVESNPFIGMHNNVFGTETILEASAQAQVKSFTLISTDKAVRPTNIMGASKRISEILCQITASKYSDMTISIVRFGNVIDSSGSVIPKFREQIRRGGPVTVTHPDISRFFMGIPEASQLVLQASSLAEKSGDVFVLDMGEPIKIFDLVKKLIKLSGKSIKDGNNSSKNTIEIIYTGLRPGEKIYEELSISGKAHSTKHPKIKKMKEKYPSNESMMAFMKKLKLMLDNNNVSALKSLLLTIDIGYTNPEKSIYKDNKDISRFCDKKESSTSSFLKDKSGSKNSLKRIKSNIVSKNFIANKFHILRKRLFLSALHKYFLLSRALTMGVRCVVLNGGDEVLLVKHTYIEGWHLPGGGIGVGESAQEAVIREVHEETGYMLTQRPELICISQCKDTSKRDHVALFLIEGFFKKRQEFSSFEISDAKFYSIDNLPSDIDEMTKIWLADALSKSQRVKEALKII